MTKEVQSERLGIRLTPSEVKMLEALSEATGRTMTNVIREEIRAAHERRFPGQSLPKPKARKRK